MELLDFLSKIKACMAIADERRGEEIPLDDSHPGIIIIRPKSKVRFYGLRLTRSGYSAYFDDLKGKDLAKLSDVYDDLMEWKEL